MWTVASGFQRCAEPGNHSVRPRPRSVPFQSGKGKHSGPFSRPYAFSLPCSGHPGKEAGPVAQKIIIFFFCFCLREGVAEWKTSTSQCLRCPEISPWLPTASSLSQAEDLGFQVPEGRSLGGKGGCGGGGGQIPPKSPATPTTFPPPFLLWLTLSRPPFWGREATLHTACRDPPVSAS